MSRSHLQISAAPGDLVCATEMVETFCGAHKLPNETSNLMNLVLDEVLSNIVKYAYDTAAVGPIDIELVYSNNELTAFVEDRGVPFNPLAQQSVVQGGPLRSRREGGLGIIFVKSLLDGVGYERIGDRNKVTLTIKVRSEEPSGE
jgi:anti-sigma regulatory factor (Ser/Thr protein kinase)